MSYFLLKHKPSVMSLIILCVFSNVSKGQETQPLEEDEAPIVVMAEKGTSATKSNTKIKDIPQSITTVSQAEIKQRAVNGVDAALQYVAGVTATAYGSDPRSDWMMVRGFMPSIYLDGMALPNGTWTASSRMEPYGLSQIEVLKGPSSVMYGQIPPGGMVNLISKKPGDELIREVEVKYGSEQQKQIAFDYADAVSDAQTVQYRLTGLVSDGNTVVNYGKDKRYFFAPSLTWSISDATSLTLLGRYQKSASGLAGGFLPMRGTLTDNPNGKISPKLMTGEPGYDRYEKEMKSLGYEFKHQLTDNIVFRQNLRYADAEVFQRSVGTLDYISGSDSIVSRYVYPVEESSTSFTVDNQLSAVFHTGAVKHNLITGFDYRNGKNDNASGYGTGVANLNLYHPVYGSGVVTPDYSYHQVQKQKQYGVYAQDEMSYEKWRMTLGVRRDWAGTKTTDMMAGKSSQQDDAAWSGRAAFGYAFSGNVSAYTAYSTSFQPTIGTSFNGNAFQPSAGKQLEFGLKYQPSRRTLVTAAVYNMMQSNVAVVDPEHIFYSLQQGKVRVKGAEIEAKVQVSDGLSVGANYSYSDTKITQTTIPSLLNTSIPLVPHHQAGLVMNYDFNQDTLKGLSLMGAIRYMGKHYGAVGNTLETPEYATFDAGIGYRYQEWQFQLNASNLFNKQYVSACNQTYWCYYGAPRNLSLTARLAF